RLGPVGPLKRTHWKELPAGHPRLGREAQRRLRPALPLEYGEHQAGQSRTLSAPHNTHLLRPEPFPSFRLYRPSSALPEPDAGQAFDIAPTTVKVGCRRSKGGIPPCYLVDISGWTGRQKDSLRISLDALFVRAEMRNRQIISFDVNKGISDPTWCICPAVCFE